MKRWIVYGSEYGTTRRYAEACSARTGIPAVDYRSAPDLGSCNQVIYFGGLYAGGVCGLKKTIKSLSPDVQLILVTVGSYLIFALFYVLMYVVTSREYFKIVSKKR